MKLCVSCGDPVAENLVNIQGVKFRVKKHCETCFRELTTGEIPRGYVHHTDTRTGGGIRVMRNEKSQQ